MAFVDDHTLVRTGLVGLVNRLGGYRVVLEADDGREFTKALPKGPNIDIAIVDLNMPIMDGYATIAWLHKNHPTSRRWPSPSMPANRPPYAPCTWARAVSCSRT